MGSTDGALLARWVEGGDAAAVAGAARGAAIAVTAAALVVAAGAYFAFGGAGGTAEPDTSAAPANADAVVADTAPVERADSGRAAVRTDREAAGHVPDPAPEPSRSVAGTVRTEDGHPVPGAEVLLVVLASDDGMAFMDAGHLRHERMSAARSDESGRFKIRGVTVSGRAWLCAFREGFTGGRVGIQLAEDADPEDVTITLAAGRTLHGRVTAPDGAPVGDAVVTVVYTWHAKDYLWGSGFARTDEVGEFRIGVDRDAEACNVRVNSAAHGQDFFFEVPVDSYADLRWHPRAVLRGQVAGLSPEAAGTVAVEVRGTLPEPPVPVMLSGIRPPIGHRGVVAADGRYEVEGLQPGVEYDAFLARLGGDEGENPRAKPLSPQWQNRFTPGPGEVVERNFVLDAPITVRGRVRTETTGRPVPRARIEVHKDGKQLWDAYAESGQDGAFELRLTAGPGTYRLRAAPGHAREGLPERHFVERRLRAGEELELDLLTLEPTVLPIRVVDARGNPVQSIRTELHVETAGGRRAGIGDSRRLDEDGSSRIEMYMEVAAFRLEVSQFPRGPLVSTRRFEPAPGTVLPEETIQLPETCGVAGTVRGDDGEPLAEASVTVTAVYDDGSKDRCHCRTDRAGHFEEDGVFRTERAVFEVRHEGRSWRSPPLAPGADGRVELGDVVVQ